MITPLDIFSWETWALIGSILFLTRWCINKQWRVLKDLQIPHDPPSILQIGNLRSMISDPNIIFTFDIAQRKKHGPIYGTYNWLTPRITIGDPDIVKQIMIKEASTFQDRQRTFSKLNGKEMNTALTAASGEQWKRIRNSLSPTFSTSKMKDMFSLIEQCTDKTVNILNKKIKEEGGRFDAKDVFGKLSMDAICSSAFGVSINPEDEESELVEKSKKLFSTNFFGVFAVIFMLFPWTERVAEKLNWSFFDSKLLGYYKRLIDSVIRSKKAAKEKARPDILQGMLTAEIDEKELKNGASKGITRTEIVGNAMLMMMAGYETTANTIILLAYCTATEPEVQEKLYQEILETKEKYGGLTYEAVNTMKYLDMCMKESLRLYGAAPRNSRYTDVEITVKGITIPANTHVDIPVHAFHHDEEYWHEPWKFIPERFEDMSKIDPIVYQPFGAGPRICIGQRFAILEIKMAICKLLMNFELRTCEDTPKPPLPMTFRASMQPKDDVFLRVKPRQEVVAS